MYNESSPMWEMLQKWKIIHSTHRWITTVRLFNHEKCVWYHLKMFVERKYTCHIYTNLYISLPVYQTSLSSHTAIIYNSRCKFRPKYWLTNWNGYNLHILITITNFIAVWITISKTSIKDYWIWLGVPMSRFLGNLAKSTIWLHPTCSDR